MQKNNRQIWAFIINAFILILLFVLRYSGLATLRIGQAVPVTLIPFVISVAMFYGEWKGAVCGFAAGALMDGSMSGSSCFNTLTVMFIGLVSGVLASRYLNRNIKSALCLSLGGAFVYLFLRLTFFYSFKGFSIGSDYFGYYFIPTVFYTAVFVIPFYFAEKKLREL